jgi:hypothetical protein
MTMSEPCEYSLCNCTVEVDDPSDVYCSDICRERDNSDEEYEVACECGHPPCDER